MLVNELTPAAPPVAAIVISVALFQVNVTLAPSVKLTVESDPVAASSFKGTELLDLASACSVYVSPPHEVL